MDQRIPRDRKVHKTNNNTCGQHAQHATHLIQKDIKEEFNQQ